MGEVGEDGDGAELPEATDPPEAVLSVSAQENQEQEDLRNDLPMF